jgi:uncharacterized surface protein with fasciclin (FAS1) repeats
MSDKLNLFDTIKKEDKFSTFTRLMVSSGINDEISSGTFTVFVPTNDAFAKIPDARINELTSEAGHSKLKSLISYHILPSKVMAASLVSAPARKALTGEELMFTDVNGLKVNGSSIQARNLEATNGVIHALDTVLTPTRIPAVAITPTVRPTAFGSGPSAVPASASPASTTTPLGSPGISGVTAAASGKSIL